MSSCATCVKHGPILFAHNENIAHVMPHDTAHALTSCVHRTARASRQEGKLATLIIHGVTGITYRCAVCASQTIFIKNNHLTF